MALLYSGVVAVMTPHCQMYRRLRNWPRGVPSNLEDANDPANVAINDYSSDEFSDGISDERQPKKNTGTRRKINFQEEALHLEKRKIKVME